MCDEGPRVSVKEYRFAEEQDEQERGEPKPELVVQIPEVLDSQYGMYVWPCAVVLAQYLWFHRRILPGKRILEKQQSPVAPYRLTDILEHELSWVNTHFVGSDKIGAGVSLPGIVAAKCGAKVILSDTEELPQCLKNCERSCRINNLLGVHIIGLTWGQISPNLLSLPEVDIILASDVFFEPEDFEDVITTVYFLMKRNPDAQFWTTYQVRSSDWSIEALLYKWKLKNVHVPLRSFNADKEQLASSPLPGRHTIEMMIISLAGASYM